MSQRTTRPGLTSPSGADARTDWIFTFGSGQEHDGHYVVIYGTYGEARAEMIRHFGNRWAFQYATARLAGVAEHGMVELPREEWPTPAPEATPEPASEVVTHALRGPWQAVLTDDYGFVLDNLDDSSPEDEVRISIRRGSALPTERHGNLRLPGTCMSGDVIKLWDNLYVEDGDPSTDAAARWTQAQAMAAGLNVAGGAR